VVGATLLRMTDILTCRPRRVDPFIAHEVAEQFLATASMPREPVVAAAYRRLAEESHLAFVRLTAPSSTGDGIRVVFTRTSEPYSSDREMIAAVRSGLVLEVTTVATQPDRSHPVMSCEVGGAYDRFRAVHDLVGHVIPGLGFDRDGEFTAWLRQDRLHSPLARWALATELHAEHSVRWTTGAPAEHKALLLDRVLLARARCGDRGGCSSYEPMTVQCASE
jgi:hypothetical protein